MLISAITAALIMGLFGGVHCAAMCGPLAIAGCSTGGRPEVKSAIEYALGRFVSYALLGAIGGFAGRLFEANSFEAASTAILFAAALYFVVKGVRILFAGRTRGSNPLVRIGAQPRSRLFDLLHLPKRGLALGVFTGALPCGLLYGALALSATAGSAIAGSLVMIAFAIATLPGLFAPLLLARRARELISPKWQGALWCALGVWLVVAHTHGGSCHG